jgi:hypothetical protein
MSNDLTVPSIMTAAAAAEPAGQAKAVVSVSAVDIKPVTPVEPNPSLELDPALGLVVIQFRNDSGAVTDSIPSERQLAAYQRWATTQFGPAPTGMPAIGAPAAGHAEPHAVAIPQTARQSDLNKAHK